MTEDTGHGFETPAHNQRAVKGWATDITEDRGGTHSGPELCGNPGESLPGEPQISQCWGR